MHLCLGEEDRAPSSILTPTVRLAIGLWMVVSTSLLFGWFSCRHTSYPFASKLPMIIERLSDFVHSLPFYASIEDSGTMVLISLVVDCV